MFSGKDEKERRDVVLRRNPTHEAQYSCARDMCKISASGVDLPLSSLYVGTTSENNLSVMHCWKDEGDVGRYFQGSSRSVETNDVLRF